MSKKVLLVERSLAVRGIAESLLRQNGYEVLAAEGADGAREILHGSKIDLLLVASDIADKNGLRFYEALGGDNTTAVIPLLIMHDQTEGELAYPPEAVIGKPFTPREFLDKVAAFSGGHAPSVTTETSPFADAGVEDDLIDAALGLDKLDVKDSEVMGNDTGVYRIQNKKVTKESMIGFDYKAGAEESTITRKKIEQVSVPAESAPPSEAKAEQPAEKKPGQPAEKKPEQPAEKKPEQPAGKEGDFLGNDSDKVRPRPVNGLSESSKIEIVPDQYGMITPPSSEDLAGADGKDSSHDYNWFINELQKEGDPKAKASSDTGSLTIAPASEGLDPAAPPPESPAPPSPPAAAPPADSPAQPHNEAVDKFISEFKKEMEKISDEAVPDIPVTNIAPDRAAEPKTPEKPETALPWDNAVEKLSPDMIRDFTRELIEAVSGRVADQIVARLDPEKVYRLLQECFFELRDKKYKP